MNDIFKSEKEAIDWVMLNTPFAIKPIRKAKTILVNPFTSSHSFIVVTEVLGKELYKLQQQLKQYTNKDL